MARFVLVLTVFLNAVVLVRGTTITSPPATTTVSTPSFPWGCATIDCWCDLLSRTRISTTASDGCVYCGCTSIPSPPSPSPTPSPSLIYDQVLWGQCGGLGWTGSRKCREGHCVHYNDWWSKSTFLKSGPLWMDAKSRALQVNVSPDIDHMISRQRLSV